VPAGAVKAKWMTEWGEPVVGVTVSGPDPPTAPDVVVLVVVELVGAVGLVVDVVAGVVAGVVADAPPAPPVLVVSELCAQPESPALSASVAAARARRVRPWA
jgi:hypothetical protein